MSQKAIKSTESPEKKVGQTKSQSDHKKSLDDKVEEEKPQISTEDEVNKP